MRDLSDDSAVEEPYGVIVVPKDYDTSWMAYRSFYLGWKVIIAPVALKHIKADNS